MQPSFDEFLIVLEAKFEMDFSFNDKSFEIIKLGDGIEIFDIANNYALSYDSLNEFKEYATVDGQLIIDIWNAVKEVNYLQ